MTALAGVGPSTALVLVKGSNPVLVADAVQSVQAALLGDDDAALVLETVGPERLLEGDAAGGEADLGPLVDAAQTPPFLTDRRVVVGRGLAVFGRKESVAPLVRYLEDPLPTTRLVLVWEKPAGSTARAAPLPKSLSEALTGAGAVVVDTDPGRDLAAWLRGELADAPVRLDAQAVGLVVEAVGEEAERVHSIVRTLSAVYGVGAVLGADDVAPYLGQAGGVPPWGLTDAIDRGDVPAALAVLERLLQGGGRHPLQVLATLVSHYQRMVALDGADVHDERSAAAQLGLTGSTFPARKALEQGRRLGHDRLVESLGLLAAADLDLKGARAFSWPGGSETVIEVLVARLASRVPQRGSGDRPSPGAGRRVGGSTTRRR